MKVLRIGIMPQENIRERMLAIARATTFQIVTG